MNYFSNTEMSACRWLCLLAAMVFSLNINSQISITSLPYYPAATDFNSYNPNSAANLVATIPAGWTASSQITQVYNGQGTGTSNVGGYWSYGTAGEFSLGALRSATPGNITYTLSFTNNSGATIHRINMIWDYEQWRYANTSGWNCAGTGSLAGNATLDSKDFAGVASGTNGVVSVTQVPVFAMTGLNIANGATFGISWVTTDVTNADNGISIDNLGVSMCTNPVLSLGTNPYVCQGTTTSSIAYDVAGAADQYSIDYSAAANSAGFVDVTNATLPSSPIPIAVPAAAPVANYTGTLTVRNSLAGCVSTSYNITVHVINCAAPYMKWVSFLQGSVHAGCTSTTNCNPGTGNSICYGLQYTPAHTGTLTSYTTGFFVDCSTNGDPVLSNHSCVMTDNSMKVDGCMEFGVVKINSSGNTGNLAVTQNVPVIIHQVCLAIPSSQSLNITEDVVTDLSTSIDLPGGGGSVTEFPSYATYLASWDAECVTLPLRWLDFKTERYDELMSQLDWMTADEINNSHFEIQRSNDGGRNFQTIGKVNASTSNQSVNAYQFIDRKALPGKNYYRLKQVDFDGRYDFSPVRTITFSSGAFSVSAWPNPASSELTINIDHADEDGTLFLVDLTGKRVFNKSFEHGSTVHEITVSDLEPGMYSLVVVSGENRYVEKVVIMH